MADDAVPWLDDGEARAWRGLQIMQMRLLALLAQDLVASSALSYQDYLVLVALTEAPDGRMRLFELGQALTWEKSRLSHHVARMEERGLVRRHKCESDRRGAFVVSSPKGRKAIESAAPGHVRAVRRLFLDHVTKSQLAAIAAAAEAVLDAIPAGDLGDQPDVPVNRRSRAPASRSRP